MERRISSLANVKQFMEDYCALDTPEAQEVKRLLDGYRMDSGCGWHGYSDDVVKRVRYILEQCIDVSKPVEEPKKAVEIGAGGIRIRIS